MSHPSSHRPQSRCFDFGPSLVFASLHRHPTGLVVLLTCPGSATFICPPITGCCVFFCSHITREHIQWEYNTEGAYHFVAMGNCPRRHSSNQHENHEHYEDEWTLIVQDVHHAPNGRFINIVKRNMNLLILRRIFAGAGSSEHTPTSWWFRFVCALVYCKCSYTGLEAETPVTITLFILNLYHPP